MAAPVQQTAFNAGELSEHLRGRTDTELYKRGLSFDENFVPMSQGPLLMRAGSVFVAEEPSGDPTFRLVQFRVSGSADDYVLVFSHGRMRVYSLATGALVNIEPNLVVNGHFDSALSSWSGGVWVNGAMKIGNLASSQQSVAVTAGVAHTLRFRVRRVRFSSTRVKIDGVEVSVPANSMAWAAYSVPFVPAGAAAIVRFEDNGAAGGLADAEVDDVVVVRDGVTVTELVTPLILQVLPDMQWDGESVQNRVVLVHRLIQPQVVVFTAPSTWEVYPATFVSQPAEWGVNNWPGAVEVGFQGRMWFGSTPNEPHTFWGSRSGKAFDFTAGANPDDMVTWIVSTKGQLRWMRGQKVMLMGSDTTEHGLSATGVVTQSDFQISDQSGFGSAFVQGVHIGDQVLFVSRNRRQVRSLDYSNERGGWVSQALTFIADHLTEGKIKELHFTANMIKVVLLDGSVMGCVYDRSVEVLAWFRVTFEGRSVLSACLAEGANGAELWAIVRRGAVSGGGATGHYVERVPLFDEAGETRVTVRAAAYAFWNNVVPPSTAQGASFDLADAFAGFTASDVGLIITFTGGGKVQVESIIAANRATVHCLVSLSAEVVAELTVGGIGSGEFFFSRSLLTYVDSAKSGVIAANGTFAGLAHLNGSTVRVIVRGALYPDQVVAAGSIQAVTAQDIVDDPTLVGALVTVGLAYRAKAVTLAKGAARSGRVHSPKLGMQLNKSAQPLVNGKRLAPDRAPSTPQGQAEPLFTGRVDGTNLGWDDEGKVTIEQDLPFRTEILSLYEIAQIKET